jgi:hypothetical protein
MTRVTPCGTHGLRFLTSLVCSISLLIPGLFFQSRSEAVEREVPTPEVAAQTTACLKCHADPTIKKSQGRYSYINPELFNETGHVAKGCVSCHVATEKHPDDLKRVRILKCDSCHENQTKEYLASAHFDHATCTNCHNPHEVRSHSVVTSTQMNGQCTTCHPSDKVYDRHASWLTQTASHLERLPCISCHTEAKAFDIVMYVEKRAVNGAFEPMSQKEMAMILSADQEFSRLVDRDGDKKISLNELRKFNLSARASGVRLRSIFMPSQSSHQFQTFQNRFDCKSCHGASPQYQQKAFMLFPDLKTVRWNRVAIEDGAAIDALYGTPDFYMIGASATRNPWMSALGLLIVFGGAGVMSLHLLFRFKTRKNRRRHS